MDNTKEDVKMVKKNNIKKKNVWKGIAIAALSLGLVGGAFAYFSAIAETVPNVFEVATGEENSDGLEIVEDKWDKETNESTVFQPGMTLLKNPKAVSKVNYDGWVVMKVTVPKVYSKVGDQKNETFNPVAEINGINTTDFTYFETATVDSDEKTEYFYGYKTPVQAGGETSELFQSITIPKYTKLANPDEEGATSVSFQVDVDARLIQKINQDSGEAYEDITDAFENGFKGYFEGHSTTNP